MKYEILKNINARTKIAFYDGNLCILKEIPLSDTEMYKKLIDLDCKNVIKFYETVADEGKFYAVEEYVNGITLKNDIDNVGCYDDERTIQIILQVCEGLKAIHSLGIVHRDINPNNIMIATDGTVKIIDFGISRTIKENKNHDTEILGTQGFTAPEQFGFSQTTEKSDIYSVGVLINYMKTKELPCDRLTGGWLDEIVLKCTQIDEHFRYAGIDELMNAITKKSTLRRFIRTIPGFRKGVWWHSLIATAYYIVLFFFLVMPIFENRNFLDGLFTFSVFFFGLAMPVPILTNFKNWTSRAGFIKSKPKREKISIQVGLSVLSVIVSMVFIILDSNC